MIKKLVLVTLATLAISAALYAANLTGHAELAQIDQTGIQARIFFVDNGTHLFALGSATGLTPGHRYISLFYGPASVPGGPAACEPDGTLNGPQMIVGFWSVASDGSGTLTADKPSPSPVPFPP